MKEDIVMKKTWKKSLAAALAMGLVVMLSAGCGGGDAKKDAAKDTKASAGKIVQLKSEKEADLLAQAKKEGSVKVYSITSRVSKAGAAFEKKYGIKVIASNLKDFELIDKIST